MASVRVATLSAVAMTPLSRSELPTPDPRADELVTLILTALNMSPDPLTLWSNVESVVNQHFFRQASR